MTGRGSITLSDRDMEYAEQTARGRNATGGTSRPLDSGFNALRGDLVGTMAEMAVCLYYGLDYEQFVTVYATRPGAIADLTYEGYAVSVKGRERFDSPDLVVPEKDTNNDIYLLVSVDVEKRYCLLRGWVTRKELLRYEPEGWKWAANRPGASKSKKRRYVPFEALHPIRVPRHTERWSRTMK